MSQRSPRVKRREDERVLTQDPRRLRWRRQAASLTVGQLAEKAHVSQGAVSMWENGQRSADVLSLAALAKALGCEPRDLMPPEPGTNGSAA
jgi:transcriptional regulator with XRE-family HTH domain